jgi:hypothetical protein
MWIGQKIYFLSDRDGPVNLYVYDTNSKRVSAAMRSNGIDIKSASAGPDAIVYEQFGSIHLFDPASGKENLVRIHVTGDFPAVRPHFVDVGDKIERAKKILKAKTETEAMDKALERVIKEERERVRRKELMKRIIELRSSLGKIQEDSAGWVRLARKEKTLSYDSGA